MTVKEQLRNFTTERPVAVLMVFTALVVFGFFSLNRLPVTLMPELTYPTLTVRTEYPGAAPEEVENDISRPIEEQLGVIGGLKRANSISRAGVSDVVLEFNWGTNMSEASQATLEKLDLVLLPAEAKRPLILQFDPSLDPIMELSFSGEGDRFAGEQGLRRLRRIADLQIKRALEPIKGVAAVRVRGGLEEEIHVLLDEEKLKRSNLAIQTVIDRLREENINVAGGTVKEGRAEYMVRTLNEYENIDQIAETVVLREAGRNLRIKDLGEVVLSNKELQLVTKTDGHESVQIDIYKEADANMVDLAKRIREAIGDYKESDKDKLAKAQKAEKGDKDKRDERRHDSDEKLARSLYQAEGAVLQVMADRSTFIKSSIDEVKSTALLGGLLAVLILYLFLRNIRSTVIIAVSIPMSLMMTFAPLNLFGISLNIMSLGGLALGVGMLVDNSIVVLESIFRCLEEGDDLKTAAVRGTVEVRGAVFSSTLTSIAVFFPMVFVEGIAGQAFSDLGLAVVVSLLASYVVAVFFIPMLASRGGMGFNAPQQSGEAKRFLTSPAAFKASYQKMPAAAKFLILPVVYLILRLVIGVVFELLGKVILSVIWALLAIAGLSGKALGKVFGIIAWVPEQVAQFFLDRLSRWYPIAVRWTLANPTIVILIMVGCFWLTWDLGKGLENELLPQVHQGEFTFEVNLPVGTPIEQTRAALEQVEAAILADRADIRSLLVTFGYDVTNTKRSDEGEHSAKFKVVLMPNKDQVAVEERVIGRLRDKFTGLPDIDVHVTRPVLFSEKTPIEVEIRGDDLDVLKASANQARNLLKGLPELADVETTLRAGAPEVQVVYDRDQIMRLGLNIGNVARSVRDKVKGSEATRYNMKDRRVPIIVRLNESDRNRLEGVGNLVVNPGSDHPIPLSAVAELVMGEGPSEVRRVEGQRVALINANIANGSLGTAVGAIEGALQRLDWPSDVTYAIAGQSKEWDQSKNSLFLALALSLFLVYVIMAAQFESLIHPLIIMFTIPLAGFGTVVGLKLLGIPLSIVVFLGMIMLAGIVVNNAIILIDYINTLRQRGVPLHDAIVEAGKVRLRPILMTTSTTILGLLPMALGLGDGAEIRTPMAITVIFGLLTSTALTLLMIPTLYYVVDRWRGRGVDPAAETSQVEELPA